MSQVPFPPADPLHVLLLTGRFEVRGSCAYSLRLAKGLPSRGIAPQVICPDAQLVDPAQRRSLGLREVPRLDSPLWGRLSVSLLARELIRNPPRMIHVQSRRVLWQGNWLARRLRLPLVVTVHDHPQPHEKLPVDRLWCRRIIAVSESVRSDILSRTDLPGELVSVIASGVETGHQLECPVPFEPTHVPVVGTAGPLEAVKGVPFFLSAAQQVLETGRDVEFVVAGAGPEEANLRYLARQLGIAGRVTFVPYLFDFAKSLKAMDVFCLPSLQQGLGTIMLEAMSLGRPVIASGVGGVFSVVRDGETGLIVPPSNSGELARRILELLNDPVRARAIGTAARHLVEGQFNVDRMVDQTAELYRAVAVESQTSAMHA